MSQRKRLVRTTFRRMVFERDGGKCLICGATNNLAAHHITDRTKMPNGGYARDNGITLCPSCHEKAEHFHSTGVALTGWHPDDLYREINSDYETAFLESRRLDGFDANPCIPCSRFESG